MSQIAAALATGNAVLARLAKQTSLITKYASHLLPQAGAPRSALQTSVGDVAVGAALTRDAQLNGAAFIGKRLSLDIFAQYDGRPSASLALIDN